MKIPQHKADWFTKNQFPVEEMEMAIADFNEDANAKDAPRKEVAIIMAQRKKVAEETVPVEKADMPPEEEKEEEEEMEKTVYVTQEEVAEVVVGLIKGHEDAFAAIPELVKEVKMLREKVEALEATDEEKLSKQKELVPQASLQSIIADRLLKEQPSGNLDRHPSLNRDRKPEETPVPEVMKAGIGIPFLDTQIRGGKTNA